MSFLIDGLRRGRFSNSATFLLSSFLVLGTAACSSDTNDAPNQELDAGKDGNDGPGKDDSGSPDGGDRDGDADVDPALASIEVTPAEASVKEGRTLQLEAKALDESDAELPDIAFTWESEDETIATVDDAGLVTTLVPGKVTITAKASGKSAKATLTVTEATIESLELQLDATEIPVDGKVAISVIVKDDEGFELQGRDIGFESEDEAVARIDGDGKVLGFGPGETQIVASAGGVEESIEVRVVHRFTKLFAGSNHACGLTIAGRAWCWGANNDGQIGHGDEPIDDKGPVRVAVDPAVVFESLALGHQFSCGLTDERKVWCWGSNDRLQLGDESADSTSTPRLLADRTYKKMSALDSSVCGLDDSGFAHCWGGSSDDYELGNPDETDDSATPVPVFAPVGEVVPVAFTELESGASHACGLTSAGRLLCWGYNYDGQVGDGTDESRARAKAPFDGKTVKAFALRDHSSCATTSDETTYCWGQNLAGLIPGGPASVRVPTKAFDKADFVPASLALGQKHACALDSEGRAFCWGSNEYGQLGRDLAFEKLPLGEVEGGHRFTSLIAGELFTCGLGEDAKTYCWGYNAHDQLGNGTWQKSMVPTLVSGQ